MSIQEEALTSSETAAESTPASSFSWKDMGSGIVFPVAIMLVFYFLVIRPQQKKMKDQQNMVNALKKGDKVITVSGIYATVTKIENDSNTAIIEVAPEVKMKIKKDAVSQVINETKS